MNQRINQLRSEISDKMVKKFGMKIDFDEMEEAVLTRLLAKQTNSTMKLRDNEKEIQKLHVMQLFECKIWSAVQSRSNNFRLFFL